MSRDRLSSHCSMESHHKRNTMSTHSDSHASPTRDPTTLDHLMHSTTWKKIRTLPEMRMKHDSHLLLIRTLQWKNITPRNIQIRTIPQKMGCTNQLQRKWKQITHGAETRLMKLLQEHHKKQSKALTALTTTGRCCRLVYEHPAGQPEKSETNSEEKENEKTHIPPPRPHTETKKQEKIPPHSSHLQHTKH